MLIPSVTSGLHLPPTPPPLQAPPAAPAPGDGANGSAAIAEKKEKVETKEPVGANA